MWFWEKESSKAENEYFDSRAKERWEIDKNELYLVRGKMFINEKQYTTLDVNYYIESFEIFSDMVSVALDIMYTLLRNCFVFTHIYNDVIEPVKKGLFPPKIHYENNPTFAKSYIAAVSAHNCQVGEYFCNEKKDSFVTFTKGINRPTLKTFYDVIDGDHTMESFIYGFLKSPRNATGNDYASVVDFLSKDNYDFLIFLSSGYVSLHMYLNSEYFNEDETIRTIQNVCEKNGKNLHGV
ncbi:hypothetical protein AGMMS49975_18110 [Clostridia bacterium]|nr:hypothetical protein AGMMS49975_18110 [Clostridia bacterium]